jgi:two-component system, cell cycle response regulator
MSLSARPLRITVVSPEMAVLHELSWVLTAVGYSVVTSKDISEKAAWRQFSDTDVLIFDGLSIADPTHSTLAHHSDNPLYRICLYDQASSVDLADWFAAGANDALQVPINRGEVLTRIRAGARNLEFERRMRSQSSLSCLPGMHSRQGFLHKLNKFTNQEKRTAPGRTLLTTAVDFFTGFCHEGGEAAAQRLLTALANSIQQSVESNAIVAYNGEGNFHVLFPNRDVKAVRVIAEQIAQKFVTAQTDRERRPRLTTTTTIVPWQAGASAEQLLEQAQETLATAKLSGGDCIIEQNEFAQELSAFQSELTADNSFGKVIAQDIMESFPAILERDSPNHALLAALLHSKAPVLPFVDHEGRFVGVAPSTLAADESAAWQWTASGSHALVNLGTIPHNTAFPEICRAFSAPGCHALVVVADHRPIGYLTRVGFFSLIRPIDSATYTNNEAVSEDSRHLLVGSLVNELEPASGSDQLDFHLPLRRSSDQSGRPAMT